MPKCVLCGKHFFTKGGLEEHLKKEGCPSREGHSRQHEDDDDLIAAGLVGAAVGLGVGAALSQCGSCSESESSSEESGSSSGGGDFGGGGAEDSFGDSGSSDSGSSGGGDD